MASELPNGLMTNFIVPADSLCRTGDLLLKAICMSNNYELKCTIESRLVPGLS